jgi:hypothetical protein
VNKENYVVLIKVAKATKTGESDYKMISGTDAKFGPKVDESPAVLIAASVLWLLDQFGSKTDKEANATMIAVVQDFVATLEAGDPNADEEEASLPPSADVDVDVTFNDEVGEG